MPEGWPRLAAGGRWERSPRWLHSRLLAQVGPPRLAGQQQERACGATQRDPAPDHIGRQQGWAAVGSQLAFCHGCESATHLRGPFTGLRVAPYPCPPTEACLHGGQACSQSTFSTLPMIFSSKTGSAASSSRTSSNTTPQSNSSLTFLK